MAVAIIMSQLAPPPTPAQNVPAGAALIMGAFLLVAIMSALGKGAGVSTSAIVFFQNFISLLLFLPWALHDGVAGLKTQHLLLQGVRGLGGVLSQALMFIAILKMPLMNTVLLSNSAPLFIPVVAWIWLKEKIRFRTAISLVIGFVGVLFILRPGPELLRNPAALLATAAAICSAIALVTVNRLSSTEPTYRILFYYFLTASLLTAPFLPFGWHSPDKKQWLSLLGIGICQAAVQLLIIIAYQYAKPGRIAPFNYSVVVFSGLIGWIVWHDRPDALALAGVLLVTAGGIFTTLKAGPNTHGHFGWIGHWNAERLHLRKWERKWLRQQFPAKTSNAF
ncbi:MAG: DMT family transporter [Tepidisphaeraceae bacterium]|jgi:drug/metabolite transporter (DMT)-like permease